MPVLASLVWKLYVSDQLAHIDLLLMKTGKSDTPLGEVH